MKKALFISSRPIYPIIGGDQIRTAQQLDYLLQLDISIKMRLNTRMAKI